jgi:imidazole glycerol-phosphate synthase subunit HisH
MTEKLQPRVAIVDYGVGNLFSVAQACNAVGLKAEITSDASRIARADAIVLPGVGAFGFAMAALERLNIANILRDAVDNEKPLLGVCLGFQLLFSASEEHGHTNGLGFFEGTVRPLAALAKTPTQTLRIPNVNWLPIMPTAKHDGWSSGLLRDLAPGASMYFVHSYAVDGVNPDDAVAHTDYAGIEYVCAVEKKRLFGCQFHPEKSAAQGLAIYRSFANSIG